MIKINIKGSKELITNLEKLSSNLKNTNDLFGILSRSVQSFLRGRAPVVTGLFRSQIKVLSASNRHLTIGEDVDYVEYANRVIFGRNDKGGPFSTLGYQMFDKATNEVKTIVENETNRWVNTKLLGFR